MNMDRQDEEECMKVGLSMEDALFGSRWILGVNQFATGLR